MREQPRAADAAHPPAHIDVRKQTDIDVREQPRAAHPSDNVTSERTDKAVSDRGDTDLRDQPDTVDDRTDNDTGQFRAAVERADRTQLPPPGYAAPIPPPLPQDDASPRNDAPPAAQDESDVGSNDAASEDPRRQ